MTPFTRQMTAVLAVAMLMTASPALAALQPSMDIGAGVAPVPMPIPIGEQLFAAHRHPPAPALRQVSAYDSVEIERRNLLLAPPGDETLRLWLAGATGFVVVALLLLAMLGRKPGEERSAGA